MGSANISKDDQITPYIEGVRSDLPGKSTTFMDNMGDLLVEELQVESPIGETQELHDLAMWLPQGDLVRYIFSASGHFDPVVEGHEIMGVFLTEKQTRWWFWYLNNVLGGSYDVKYGTGNKTPENDYPARALANADSDIEMELDQFYYDVFGR